MDTKLRTWSIPVARWAFTTNRKSTRSIESYIILLEHLLVPLSLTIHGYPWINLNTHVSPSRPISGFCAAPRHQMALQRPIAMLKSLP